MRTLVLLASACLALGATSGCSPAAAYCEKSKECQSDPPGEDYVRVCSVVYDGNIRALNANSEEECRTLANATLALDACRAQLDCDDFNEADLGSNCDQELDDYQDALEDSFSGGVSSCSALD